MIDREDMLALTRRMTVKRTSITRIAGCYFDCDGYIDGTFNTSFLELPDREKSRNLAIAKAVPFADTNRSLRRFSFPKEARGSGSMWQCLQGIRACGLKNDALLEGFYELVGQSCQMEREFAFFLFHDRYDIPDKGTDHERQWESERMFEYIIGTFSLLEGEYVPGMPEWGFLFPAFSGGGAMMNAIDIFQADGKNPHRELMHLLGIG